MVNLGHRLRRIERKASSRRTLSSLPRDEVLEMIRENAMHANRCAKGDPPFVVTEEGVYCSADGRPVTDLLQTGTEVMYWLEVACHEDEIAEGLEPHVAHDEEEQAFYAPDGKLVLSREYVDLRGVFGCLDAAIAEERGEGYS